MTDSDKYFIGGGGGGGGDISVCCYTTDVMLTMLRLLLLLLPLEGIFRAVFALFVAAFFGFSVDGGDT